MQISLQYYYSKEGFKIVLGQALNIISKRIDLFVDRIKDLNANTQYLNNMAIVY